MMELTTNIATSNSDEMGELTDGSDQVHCQFASPTMPVKSRSSTTAVNRLMQDYSKLTKDPVPYVSAVPLPSNIFEWHYVIRGPEDSYYKDGYYHGKLVFPRDYPFRPPAIYMITPNGRFQCNTALCLSISNFHPESWNPAWSVASILTGLLSFMLENTQTLGSIDSSVSTKRIMAKKSGEFNLNSDLFRELFPDVTEEIRSHIANTSASSSQSTPVESEQPNIWKVSTIFVICVASIFGIMVRIVLRFLSEPP